MNDWTTKNDHERWLISTKTLTPCQYAPPACAVSEAWLARQISEGGGLHFPWQFAAMR
jgi:hypothetical protein